jgi:hypothetical protein
MKPVGAYQRVEALNTMVPRVRPRPVVAPAESPASAEEIDPSPAPARALPGQAPAPIAVRPSIQRVLDAIAAIPMSRDPAGAYRQLERLAEDDPTAFLGRNLDVTI